MTRYWWCVPTIRLSTNFMTLIPSLTFTDYEWFPWSICNGFGMQAGNAYPSGHLVSSPIVGLACALMVEARFLELAMSLLDFSLRIPLGTLSILLRERHGLQINMKWLRCSTDSRLLFTWEMSISDPGKSTYTLWNNRPVSAIFCAAPQIASPA